MRLDHIGIAVEDLDAARRLYGELLGFELGEVEELPDRQLKICFVEVGQALAHLTRLGSRQVPGQEGSGHPPSVLSGR